MFEKVRYLASRDEQSEIGANADATAFQGPRVRSLRSPDLFLPRPAMLLLCCRISADVHTGGGLSCTPKVPHPVHPWQSLVGRGSAIQERNPRIPGQAR